MKSVALWAAALGALLWVSSAAAQQDLAAPLEAAQAALAAGDYAAAYGEYLRHAEDNANPLAQFMVALFYQNGWGRAEDPVEACRWHEKAAQGKITTAQHFLAGCLVEGTHQPADPAAAATWYSKAVEGGLTGSLCSLAELYIAGKGVPKDPAKGLAICRQAAETGLVPAQVRMGRFLLEGDAELRDPGAAYRWFEFAARRKSPEAQYYLGRMTRDGLGTPRDPAAARQWFERSASQGYVPAYFPTAALYLEAPANPETGMPRAENLAKAYLWLSAVAARSRDPDELRETADGLGRIREIMPESWTPTLDEKVAKHLAEHPAR